MSLFIMKKQLKTIQITKIEKIENINVGININVVEQF